MDVVAIGTTRFTPGFSLAGIQTILATTETVMGLVKKQQGIVILDEALTATLPPDERQELATCIKPIVIALGKNSDEQFARLRAMVKTTLGVDVLK